MTEPNDKRPDHRRVFRLELAFGASGLLAAAAAVGAAVESLHRLSRTSHRVVIAGLQFTYPTLNAAEAVLLFLAALGAVAIAIAVRATWSQRQAYRGFISDVAVVGPLEGRRAVTVIADRRPRAFCAGYLRPAVYVSQPTVDLLTEAELEAVLAHEHRHRRARDPLRLACGRILSQALFFVPVLRPLSARYVDAAELSADDAAVRASEGQKAPLASALLAFDERGPPEATGISPERVDSLLGEPTDWRLPWRLTTASLVGLSALGVLIWRLGEAASADATFNLPILTSRPCLAVMTLLVLVCVGAVALRESSQSRRATATSTTLA